MPTSARPGFFPHSRQGTRALPYKALRYRARADRGVRSYGGDKGCGEGGTMWASSPTEGYKENGTRPGGGLRAARPTSLIFVRGYGRGRTPPLRRGYKECGSWQASARAGPTNWIVGADDSVRPVHSFFCLGATHIKKALCYDAGIIAKGFFILDCAYLTSSMMAVSAASPRRTPVRTMRV